MEDALAREASFYFCLVLAKTLRKASEEHYSIAGGKNIIP
jgi:hypothetical protein